MAMAALLRSFICTSISLVLLSPTSQANPPSLLSKPKPEGYTLNKVELKVLDASLLLEKQDFTKGEKVLLPWLANTPQVTSIKISEDYESNEVAADLKYKNKKILVKDKVKSINSGFNDKPFLALAGENEFNLPQASFTPSDQNLQKIAKLKKGDTVLLHCTGGGEITGTPLLDDC